MNTIADTPHIPDALFYADHFSKSEGFLANVEIKPLPLKRQKAY